jgi:SAM-dependent methyltransferase
MSSGPCSAGLATAGPTHRACVLCGAPDPHLVPGYESFHRVTSDCKPWPPGGRLCVCPACDGVQAVTDLQWRAEADRIYADYTIYYQSGGVEQKVFDSSGQSSERSARVLDWLGALGLLPDSGQVLDVGSGNGALLRAFARARPGWTLAASDLSDRFREVVERLPRVERLYTCAPPEIPGTFDLISMMHVLEHVPDPLETLCGLRDKLGPAGLLLVQTPDATRNPFDLMVADHAAHFSPAALAALVRRAGYHVVALSDDCVPKEISLVASPRPATAPRHACGGSGVHERAALEGTLIQLGWLRDVADHARRLARQRPFGVFGTSIAGAWLYGELREAFDFFVDEDPARTGKTYMGLPIYHPSEVPPGSHVFLGLAPTLAERIRGRLTAHARPAFHLHLPPSISPESVLIQS